MDSKNTIRTFESSTAIVTGGASGIGRALSEELAKRGSEVVLFDLQIELAESFGLSKPTGALIAAVEKGGPADKAGLEASDVVLKFDGKAIQNSSELPRLVGAVKPGRQVVVQVWRKGATRDVNLTVGELPAEKMAQRPGRPGKGGGRLGLALSDLTPAQRQQLRIENGILVEDSQGIAARAGIRRGDVILAINNQDVRSVEQFVQLLSRYESGRSVALLVRRGDSALYVPLKISDK